MGEWKTCKLSEIGEIVGGATPSTKNPNFYDGEIPWITPKDLTNWSDMYISKGERSITKAGYDSASCKMMPKGTVLFTSRAPIGYIAIAANDVCTNQGFKSVVPNTDLIDSQFLYYSLIFNKNKIIAMGSGTTFAEISGKVMASVEISLPPLDIQKKIAVQLSEIDDKIAVNKKICENLEAQAQALFKHWFVDFAPFKNGKFVESELGLIPEGWRVGRLGQVTSNITDGVHNTVKDVANGGFYLLSCKNIKGGIIAKGNNERTIDEETFIKLRKRTKLQKGDILLSSVGTIGEMVLLNDDLSNIEFQRSVAMIKPDSDIITPHFLFYSLMNQKEKIIHSAHGAVQQCLFISDIANFITIIPPIEEINKFTNVVKVLVDNKTCFEKENIRLSTLRDTLLPKLMSGELKVNEIKL